MDAQLETCDYVQMHIFRVPKKNHDTIVQIGNKHGRAGHEVGNKHGILRQESFVLGSTGTYEGFTNIANIVFATRDEEIWLHLNFYRDRKHRDDVMARIENDETMSQLFQQTMHLITPGSNVIGEFSRPNM
jgi:uncharacterized protein YbaA (DUF1428 family)